VIHGQLNISSVDAREMDLYRKALAQEILRNDGVLTRHLREVIANMPPPPDPFWAEVTL
jgi:hypothetical protein